eukprot:GHVO01043723.1.p2 GENE.GHVO01043723.1~~GHVO01043723.1.p2  ORF type:complete len:122 (+),score=19.37 GHVO01043723.1:783-1148(+)
MFKGQEPEEGVDPDQMDTSLRSRADFPHFGNCKPSEAAPPTSGLCHGETRDLPTESTGGKGSTSDHVIYRYTIHETSLKPKRRRPPPLLGHHVPRSSREEGGVEQVYVSRTGHVNHSVTGT